METLSLCPHAETPARKVTAVCASVARSGADWRLRFRVDGAEHLLLPSPAIPERADALWKHLCFELFVQPAGASGYYEFNFAPSSQWAAYAFDGYRHGMRELELRAPPSIKGVIDVNLTLPMLAAFRIGLSAVIEELDGTKSYWALKHPTDRPDFHHPDGFVLELGVS